MKTMIITGANGYIASLVKKKMQSTVQIITMSRKEADFSNPDMVEAWLKNQEFDYIFHTAAMAQTIDCENQPELTYRVNVESTKKIVDLCKEKKARLIFCSTEQCFNGKTNTGPFTEDEPTCAITKYGQHKIECESYIQNQLDDYLILRFSWMFGLSYPNVKASPNIIQNVMNALLHHKPTLFTVNEIRGMTYAKKLADQFDKILSLPSGIYHISNVNTHNTYDSAKIVAEKLGVSKEEIDMYILPNYKKYEDRFRDYRLSNEKIEKYGIHFDTFEENVEECLSDFQWIQKK